MSWSQHAAKVLLLARASDMLSRSSPPKSVTTCAACLSDACPDTLNMSHLHRSLRILRPSCAVLLCLSFLAPALAAAHARPCEAYARRTHLSLPVAQLQSWEPVDARTVLVWTPNTRRAHLLHLDRRLRGLPDAAVITLIDGDHDGKITACGHDGILVSKRRGGRAYIRSMEYLSQKRTVELDRRGGSVNTIEARLTAPQRPKRPG